MNEILAASLVVLIICLAYKAMINDLNNLDE
jgi:hypothetical protein